MFCHLSSAVPDISWCRCQVARVDDISFLCIPLSEGCQTQCPGVLRSNDKIYLSHKLYSLSVVGNCATSILPSPSASAPSISSIGLKQDSSRQRTPALGSPFCKSERCTTACVPYPTDCRVSLPTAKNSSISKNREGFSISPLGPVTLAYITTSVVSGNT